jgi:hypothetical protein
MLNKLVSQKVIEKITWNQTDFFFFAY